jgi:hypothetical protein
MYKIVKTLPNKLIYYNDDLRHISKYNIFDLKSLQRIYPITKQNIKNKHN